MRILLLVCFLGLPLLVRAQSDETVRTRTVTVQGTGILHVMPDEATIRFAIVTRADRPREAQQENEQIAARTLNAVRVLGIPDRYMRLTALRLSEYRERIPESREMRRGYEAYREFTVRVDSLDLVPELIARVVEEGGNRLLGIGYDVQDRERLEREALRQAAIHAREKARTLARTLGAQPGPVLQIHEQGVHMPVPLYQPRVAMEKMDMATAEPAAYAVGEIEVRATVSVVFMLDQGKIPRSR